MAVDCLLDRVIQQFGSPLLCGIDGEPLLPGQIIQFDHVQAVVHEGPHTYRDIRPVHYDPCHKRKTKADIQAKFKIDRLKNPKPSKRPMQNSGRKIQSRPFRKRPPKPQDGL